MNIIYLPPGPAPKLPSARSGSKSLGDHMQGFLSRYAHCPEEQEEQQVARATMKRSHSDSIFGLLKKLHAVRNAPQVAIEYKAKEIQRIYPTSISLPGSRSIITASYGFQHYQQLTASMKVRDDGKRVIDHTKSMTLFQSLFCHLVKSGEIVSPTDVVIPELKVYASIDFIAAIKAGIEKEKADIEKKKADKKYRIENIDTELLEIECAILADRLIVLTDEQYAVAKRFSIVDEKGDQVFPHLSKYAVADLKVRKDWCNYRFNQIFMYHRQRSIEHKLKGYQGTDVDDVKRRLNTIVTWMKQYVK